MSSIANDTATALTTVQQMIQRGDVRAALVAIEALPSDAQQSLMGAYMKGVCLRNLRDFAAAENVLLTLIEQHPSYGRAFQELGHLYRDASMPIEALNAYATACHLNPGLRASWAGQRALVGEGAPEPSPPVVTPHPDYVPPQENPGAHAAHIAHAAHAEAHARAQCER